VPQHRHVVEVFYLPTCNHCKKVIPILREVASTRPDIRLIETSASTRDGGKRLKALGYREVPIVVIDDTYVIKGDRDFRPKLNQVLPILTPRRNQFEKL